MESAGFKEIVTETPTFRSLLDSDWSRLAMLSGAQVTGFRWRFVFNPRFGAVVLLRCSHAAYQKKWRRLAKFISFINFLIFNIEVPVSLQIGPGLVLPHPQGVILGAGRIGSNVTIFQQVTLGAKTLDMGYDLSKRPTVESDVTISAGAKVIGGVVIGAGAMVGANAVVLNDLPQESVAVGVPARVK